MSHLTRRRRCHGNADIGGRDQKPLFSEYLERIPDRPTTHAVLLRHRLLFEGFSDRQSTVENVVLYLMRNLLRYGIENLISKHVPPRTIDLVGMQ